MSGTVRLNRYLAAGGLGTRREVEGLLRTERVTVNGTTCTDPAVQIGSADSVLLDGQPVELCANIELPDDVPQTLENGAAGIGLFRSEFLFLHREGLPTEDEHWYGRAASPAAHGSRWSTTTPISRPPPPSSPSSKCGSPSAAAFDRTRTQRHLDPVGGGVVSAGR
jgi:hypothetical protein